MKKGFLDKLKKNFEVIASNCAYEEYSAGIRVFNETLSFSTDLEVEQEFLERVCEIIDFYYILYKVGIQDMGFLNLRDKYKECFIKPEGAEHKHITMELLEDIYSFLDNERFLEELQSRIETLKSHNKKIIFQNRAKWNFDKVLENNKIYCYRRLGILICDKNTKHKEQI